MLRKIQGSRTLPNSIARADHIDNCRELSFEAGEVVLIRPGWAHPDGGYLNGNRKEFLVTFRTDGPIRKMPVFPWLCISVARARQRWVTPADARRKARHASLAAIRSTMTVGSAD